MQTTQTGEMESTCYIHVAAFKFPALFSAHSTKDHFLCDFQAAAALSRLNRSQRVRPGQDAGIFALSLSRLRDGQTLDFHVNLG